LQKVMQNLVGIFRTEEDLTTALAELEKLKQRAARVRVEGSRLFNPGWHLARDLRCMLTVSEAVARSAQARKESRGAHSRIDYPNSDEKVWGKQNNVISRGSDGSMNLRQVPVTEMPDELKKVLEEEK
jgi:succinate dehydrogenase / fumarate reductase, flavoprotein subunit